MWDGPAQYDQLEEHYQDDYRQYVPTCSKQCFSEINQ